MKISLQCLFRLPKSLPNSLPIFLILVGSMGLMSESAAASASASASAGSPPALAESSSEKHEADPVFAAMSDEMKRSLDFLKMDQHLLPYFISYEIKDVNEITMSSILGSRPSPWRERYRLLTPQLRIGNYEFDSSFPRTSYSHFVSRVPIEDDYSVLRRALWQTTDNAYKNAIRSYEWKKAYLASNNMPERLTDMTREKAHQDIEPTFELPELESKWSDAIAQLSAVFRNYPALQKSKVTFVGRVVKRRFLNSEGTKIQDARAIYAIRLWAECQASDGMQFNDYDVIANTDADKLPSIEVLKKRTQDFAQHLVDLRSAPLAEEYCGPVLFEGQGGAEFLATVLAPNLGFAEEYVGSDHWRNPFKNVVGRKVLPKFIDVVDNPGAKDDTGTPLLGSYKFDDEGVPAKRVTLVDNGILKGFCQSRIPIKNSDHSNGHSLDGHGVYRTLEISGSKKSTPAQLKAQLAELAKDTGLDYVLVVSKLGDDYQFVEFPSQDGAVRRSFMTPSYSTQPSDPVYVYKMYLADGRRELVRGLEFRNVSLRAFRDIQAIGDDAQPYIIEPNDHEDRSLILPSFIVGELELTPASPTHTTVPIMKSPLEIQASGANPLAVEKIHGP
jgi:TldD protein